MHWLNMVLIMHWSEEWWLWWSSSRCASSSSWAAIWPGIKVGIASSLCGPLLRPRECAKMLEHCPLLFLTCLWPMWDCVDRDILNQWGQRSGGRPWRRHGHHQCGGELRTCRGKERVLHLAPLFLPFCCVTVTATLLAGPGRALSHSVQPAGAPGLPPQTPKGAYLSL